MEFDREIVRDGAGEGRGRGRPRKIDGGGVRFDAWIGVEDKAKMAEMSVKSGFSQSDLLRRMIQMHYDMNKARWGLE